MTVQINLNKREAATILAALRYLQANALDLVEQGDEHFTDHEPLNTDEIDSLCERLNQ